MKTEFDFVGTGTFEIDATGNLFIRDNNNQVIYYKNNGGDEEREWKYNVAGNCIYYNDYEGYEEWMEYDSYGNKLSCKNKYGEETWEYNSRNSCIHHTHYNGKEQWYDGKGTKITKGVTS